MVGRTVGGDRQRGRAEAEADSRLHLTLKMRPAMSMYRLMAAFWYTKQEPWRPHWLCHSRQALSITQPKAMGPGILPAKGESSFSTLMG